MVLLAVPVVLIAAVACFIMILVWYQTAKRTVKMAPPTPPHPEPPLEFRALIELERAEINAAETYEQYQSIQEKFKERRQKEFPEYMQQVKEWKEKYGEWEKYKDTILNPPSSKW